MTRIGRHPESVACLLVDGRQTLLARVSAKHARMLTGNLQFAKTTVNLIWAELMGVGIVDPPFSFDLSRQDPRAPPPSPWTIQPTHPELLEALAKDFQAHKYDLRYLITLITKSSTYQLSSRFQENGSNSQYFARHPVPAATGSGLGRHCTGNRSFRKPIRRVTRK